MYYHTETCGFKIKHLFKQIMNILCSVDTHDTCIINVIIDLESGKHKKLFTNMYMEYRSLNNLFI